MMRTPVTGLSLALAVAVAPAIAAPQGGGAPPTVTESFANFQSTQVHPIRMSADGTRLYAVQTHDARVSVFDVGAGGTLSLAREIRVGLDPVSLTERVSAAGPELWVCNQLADTVSVVDPLTGDTLGTIATEDEPSDVAFAGARAFVSCATVDRVMVFDAQSLAPVGTIDIPAKDPRALASDGERVFVLSRRSGNGTTVIAEEDAPPPPAPANPALPAAPRTALIVRADDPAWASQISYTLPDEDVFEIDPQSLTIRGAWSGVVTTGYDLAVHPRLGPVAVGTDARNLVRFEPELRGHVVDHLLVRLSRDVGAWSKRFDLNAGIRPEVLPNPLGLERALAEPTGVVFERSGAFAWVAAQGTDRVARISLRTGEAVVRVDVGEAVGSALATERMRGPRGLALSRDEARVFVFNGLSDTISVIDVAGGAVAAEIPVGSADPIPPMVRAGRNFLHDARLSGNGLSSCASCHVDGDTDGLAWDLGDPGGSIVQIPVAWQQGRFPNVVPPNFPDIHPMKGPMVTQPLRDLEDRMHWRGEKPGFASFNVTFDALMGGQEISTAEMTLFETWVETVQYPPNPNQNRDRTLTQTPFQTSQQRGFDRFNSAGFGGGPACIDCHALPNGTTGLVRDRPIGTTQPMRVGPLRDFYRKTGFSSTATGPIKAGFGRFHDGVIGELSELGPGGGGGAGAAPITAFLMAFDTGTAPVVGLTVDVTPWTAGSSAQVADRELMEARASLGEADVIAYGHLGGAPLSFLFDPATDLWRQAKAGEPLRSGAALEQLVASTQGRLVFLATPPGTGYRLGLDRDLDGVLDGDE